MLQYITINKAAKILGVTALTLRNWDKTGKLVSYRNQINNYRLYKLNDLELFLRQLERNKGKNANIKMMKEID